MKTIQNHVEAALLRGIAGAAQLDATDRKKPMLVVEEIQSLDWASATFLGARINLALRLDGEAQAVDTALAALAARLPEWEFRITGQIVADIELNLCTPDTTIAGALDACGDIVPSPGPSTVSRPFVVHTLLIID